MTPLLAVLAQCPNSLQAPGPGRGADSVRCQKPVPATWQSRLAHLDEVPVRIADVTTDLGLVLFRRREEFGASCLPLRVHSLDVRDP